MSFTSDYLLYTKGELINNVSDLVIHSFYQIDIKGQGNTSATDANVYCLETITNENNARVYHFNPMREYLFDKKEGLYNNEVKKVGDKPNVAHLTKRITESELTYYNIYKVFAQLNRGSFLSYVPLVGSSINTGLGYVPASGLVTDALNVTQKIGTGAADAISGRGGSGKRKRKTKKNKRKNRKTKKSKGKR